MLNLAEHEICPANKSQITNKCKFFLAKHSWAWTFSANKYENANYCRYFHIFLAEKISCLAEMSMKNNL